MGGCARRAKKRSHFWSRRQYGSKPLCAAESTSVSRRWASFFTMDRWSRRALVRFPAFWNSSEVPPMRKLMPPYGLPTSYTVFVSSAARTDHTRRTRSALRSSGSPPGGVV